MIELRPLLELLPMDQSAMLIEDLYAGLLAGHAATSDTRSVLDWLTSVHGGVRDRNVAVYFDRNGTPCGSAQISLSPHTSETMTEAASANAGLAFAEVISVTAARGDGMPLLHALLQEHRSRVPSRTLRYRRQTRRGIVERTVDLKKLMHRVGQASALRPFSAAGEASPLRRAEGLDLRTACSALLRGHLAVGQALSLAVRSPMAASTKVGRFSQRWVRPLSVDQTVMRLRDRKNAAAVVTWAWLDEEALGNSHRTAPEDMPLLDWNGGTNLVLIDALTTPEELPFACDWLASSFPAHDLHIYPRPTEPGRPSGQLPQRIPAHWRGEVSNELMRSTSVKLGEVVNLADQLAEKLELVST